MLCGLLCLSLLYATGVVAPPVPPPPQKCFVERSIYKGSQPPTACDDGTLRKLSDLVNSFEDIPDNEQFGTENLADLLSARGIGIFDYRKHTLEKLFICPKHLNELGKDWKKSEKLAHHGRCSIPPLEGLPDHPTGTKGDRSLMKGESLSLWRNFQEFVALGTGMCKSHKTAIRELSQSADEAENADDLDQQPHASHASPTGRNIGGHKLRHPIQKATYIFGTPVQTAGCRGQPLKQATLTGSTFTGGSEASQGSLSSQGSQASQARQCKRLQSDVKAFAKAIGIPGNRIHFPMDGQFLDLESSTKRKYVDNAVRITDAISEAFAPDVPQQFRDMICDRRRGSTNGREHSEEFLGMVEQMVHEYMNAETRRSRMELLSFMAPWFKWSELEKFIPGLTPYAWKAARRYAKMSRAGLIDDPSKKVLQRYDPKIIMEFLEFITSSQIVSDMPFGHASVKLSSGVKLEIPNLLRTFVNTRIIRQYRMWKIQRGAREDEMMSNTTMLRILKMCKATSRKSMKGLDYLTYEGTEGIVNLVTLIGKIKDITAEAVWAKDLTRVFRETKAFFKSDYKVLLKDDSQFADYSTWYALSDPIDPDFRVASLGEEVRGRCAQCIALMNAFGSIEEKIREVQWSTPIERSRAEFTFEQSKAGILNWQRHIIRTVHQDKAREDVINNLDENSVYLLLDWAMKLIPEKGKEPQTAWYGKKGISWHITVGLAKINGKIHQRTYVHVFDKTKQDGDAVVAILTDTLKRVKAELPAVSKAYLRSDNAVCYHGAITLTAAPKMSEQTGVTIERWDFSETQSGKGPADRASNTVKRHVKLFVAEGGSATTALEFVDAATSHEGVKSATFILTEMPPPSGIRQKASIPEISKYNNYQYTGNQIRVWRAYEIGVGKVVQYTASDTWPSFVAISKQTTHGEEHAALAPTKSAWIELTTETIKEGARQQPPAEDWANSFIPDELDDGEEENACSDTADSQTTTCFDPDDPSRLEGQNRWQLFPCEQEGCIKVYQSWWNWYRHVTFGRHVYRVMRQSIRDFTLTNYVKLAEGSMLFSSSPMCRSALRSQLDEETAEESAYPLEMGFGLKDRKETKRFTPDQKAYMEEKFNEGIKKSNKYDPIAVAAIMHTDERFPSKDTWLTAGQIQGFWSRLAAHREWVAADAAGAPNLDRARAIGDAPPPNGDTDLNYDDDIGSDEVVDQLLHNQLDSLIRTNEQAIFGGTDANFETRMDEVFAEVIRKAQEGEIPQQGFEVQAGAHGRGRGRGRGGAGRGRGRGDGMERGRGRGGAGRGGRGRGRGQGGTTN